MVIVTVARRTESEPWHIFLWGDGPSLCWSGVRPYHCAERRDLELPDDAARLPGVVCNDCLKRLVAIGEIAEALNTRVP